MFFLSSTFVLFFFFFFFNDTATTEIYTLSLHDALPISTLLAVALAPTVVSAQGSSPWERAALNLETTFTGPLARSRSEEHTSELQSRLHLVCRLLLEKKKKNRNYMHILNHASSTSVVYH